MNTSKYMELLDAGVGLQWEKDRAEYEFTEEDARVAQVLTRIDVGVLIGLNGTHATCLRSITLAVWLLVVMVALYLGNIFFG